MPSKSSSSVKLDLLVTLVLFRPNLDKLKTCLDSLLASKGISFRAMVMDNSPQPIDPAFWSAYEGTLGYVFGGGNVGFGAGHNRALHEAAKRGWKASYTLILNPDVYFKPTLMKDLLARMEADPRIGLAIPQIVNPDGSIQYVNKRLPTPAILFLRPLLAKVPYLGKALSPWMAHYLLQDMDLTRPLICPFISGCFMTFRSELLDKLQGFDERYFLYMEDVDLTRRAATLGLNVVFSDLKCSHYWERAAYKNRKIFMILVRSAMIYFNKWGWFFDKGRADMNRQIRYYKKP